MPGELDDFVTGLPKAEVHLHLEGCIPPDLAARAAAGAGSRAPVPTEEGRPRIESLAALLSYLDWSCALVGQPGELEEIAYSTARRLA
ncbi:MAG: hypothetical protein ACRD0B_02705, partial [Acidimicrobiales bacterium]